MNNIKTYNLNEFNNLLNQLESIIGPKGEKYFKKKGTPEKFKLNELVSKFDEIIKQTSNITEENQPTIHLIINRIRELDQTAKNQVTQKNILIRIAVAARQFFGNLSYNRNSILNRIQFPGQTLVNDRGNYTEMSLKGEKGEFKAKIRGISASTVPTLSDKGIVEYFHRTFARIRNLIAVRGHEIGARMIGPCECVGRIESPDEPITIQIVGGAPAILKSPIESEKKQNGNPPPTTLLRAEWISGNKIKPVLKTRDIKGQKLFGESLFESKGILKIAGAAHQLEKFDATKVDLSSFKAELVKSGQPFRISKEPTPPKDYPVIVTYLYESEYANQQVTTGGGLFLETHSFPQTMTPLEDACGGFVTLAKWKNETNHEEGLEVIAVEIPFGYTLHVQEQCIHGDTNLEGMFMMCMTSSHETMRTADTVFLKSAEDNDNVALSIKGGHKRYQPEKSTLPLPAVSVTP